MLIDLHSHLFYYKQAGFSVSIAEAIDRAEKAGLKIVVEAGLSIETNKKALELSEKYEIVKAALGYYPENILGKTEQQLIAEISEIESQLRKSQHTIAAVSEIGLDYNSDELKKAKGLQLFAFKKLLGIALELGKAVVVHSRKAEGDAIEALRQENVKKAVLHCFSGKKQLIKKALDYGFCFSIPTNITRSQHFQLLARLCPLDRIFCETDSPFLSPYKDKPNEPAFVIEAYKKIAEIKGISLPELKKIVFMNYQRLFL